jgi:holo-[acyl-carrier protein] synthase
MTSLSSDSPLRALRATWEASLGSIGHVVGIGIDLVETEPLRQLIEAGGSGFLDAAWTATEQQETNAQAEGLAGKWAAKEAVMKALRHGIGDLGPLDVEIVCTPTGVPDVRLHRSARTIARNQKIANWYVSITHEGGWAAAIAIATPHHLQITNGAVTAEERRSLGRTDAITGVPDKRS